MTIWQILGIDPTNDEAEIRRAYARQLKKHRPDQDPEGYQRLREAFDTAKQQSGDGFYPIAVDTAALFEIPTLFEAQAIEPTLPELENFYNQEEMQALANQLVDTEMSGIVAMNKLWEKIAEQGSLQQQLHFHQHLAASLAETPGLTEGLLDRISTLLRWGVDEYDYSHIIPEPTQYAIRQRLRETEVNRAWQAISLEEKQGSLLTKTALRLLKSDRKQVPFWVRLIPGLLPALIKQTDYLTDYYPEMIERLNPVVLAFIQEKRATLSWPGIYLLLFWGVLFYFLLKKQDIHPAAGITAITIVVFYLYINPVMMLILTPRPQWLKRWLFTEFILSLMVIQLFFGGLFFAAVIAMPSHKGDPIVTGLLAVVVLSAIIWMVSPSNAPPTRKPGGIMSRISSSPWRVIEWLNLSWFSAVWTVIYFAICFIAFSELLKLFK
ncbi:MAG: hypothetical protein XXXJIFNMEKO3_00205 [Candidatus Erwinia impunctatus]